ncbi:glycoside hydrolase family 3 N-terminal domain-containing protein [Microbacterium pullorum]|nr:glycoside hydrolase family 3 N-terminal domain-containing protein [Microbacterium pullorum]
MTDAAPLSDAERIDDLLSRMTLEEKAGQLTQFFYLKIEQSAEVDLDSIPEEYRAYVEQPAMVEAAIDRGATGSVLFVTEPALANRLQRRAVEETRLGIPLLFGSDVIHGMRTIFPVPIALAATWSPSTIELAQATAAREARASGVHWTFAPMVDITRDARWGRIVEGAGEDPVLGAAAAAAAVRGFQGTLGLENVLAGPKHFAGYGAARGGRDYDDAEVSDSELWNVYFPPFRAAIDAGAENVMSAYMDLNGVPASANTWLLTDVLRREMGFEGFVVSDADAVRSLETQHFATDQADAAVRALSAGLDMEMCMFDPASWRLPQAIRDGAIAEATLDQAVGRVLRAKLRLGLFENPYVEESAAARVLNDPSHRARARAAAEESFVLLKNDGATLPLDAESLRSVAVIGQLADSRRDTLGPWVGEHDIAETVTILDGLRRRLGGAVRVEHEAGAGIPERVFPSMFDHGDGDLEITPSDYDDDAAIGSAVALAAQSDVAIVVVGQRQNQIGERSSVSSLRLGGRQEEQLQRIAATGTPVVLLVMAGRPLDLRWADAHVPAILEVWYPGTAGGDAVAATLIGDVSPAGRLPFTWPRHEGQVPMVYSHNRTFKPDEQNARYFDEEGSPLYPFGHGLSYGQFEYADLRVDRSSVAVGESVTVSVAVTNVSDRPAGDVVQLYIHQRSGTSSRPIKELKGFERVHVPAGETAQVSFVLGPSELRYWSAATRGYVQDATTIDLWAGGSSTATLTTQLEITP